MVICGCFCQYCFSFALHGICDMLLFFETMQCNKSHFNVTVLLQWHSLLHFFKEKNKSASAHRRLVSYKWFSIVVQFVNTHRSVSVSLTKEPECTLCILIIDEGVDYLEGEGEVSGGERATVRAESLQVGGKRCEARGERWGIDITGESREVSCGRLKLLYEEFVW